MPTLAIPPELWREVFRETSLETQLALVLVCKDWNELGSEFLYKTVWLGDGSNSLMEALETSAFRSQGPGYGKWVRRVILSKRLVQQIRFLDILQYCTRINSLSKPASFNEDPGSRDHTYDTLFWGGLLHANSETSTPMAVASLVSLRYLSWSTCVPFIKQHHHLECQALSEIILHSPNLQCLRLTNYRLPQADSFGPRTCRSPETVTFPSLQSLHLMRPSDISHLKLRALDVPRLTHLSFSTFDHTLTSQVLRVLGEQLWSVGVHGYILTHDVHHIWTILQECPNIREFTYVLYPFHFKLESLVAPYPTSRIHIVLERIPQLEALRSLEDHIKALTHSTTLSLQRIILDGPWSESVERSDLLSLSAIVHARGWQLEFADGTPI